MNFHKRTRLQGACQSGGVEERPAGSLHHRVAPQLLGACRGSLSAALRSLLDAAGVPVLCAQGATGQRGLCGAAQWPGGLEGEEAAGKGRESPPS